MKMLKMRRRNNQPLMEKSKTTNENQVVKSENSGRHNDNECRISLVDKSSDPY